MKLKLLIVITVLAVIGIVVIAVVKKSNTMPEKPEITEVTTDVQVEREPEIDLNSLGGKDDKSEKEIRQWLTEKRNSASLSKADSTYYADLEAVYRSLDSLRRSK